jgi:integrase/recombinase XerD
MRLIKAVDLYLSSLTASHYSEESVKSYSYALTKFTTFIQKQFSLTNVHDNVHDRKDIKGIEDIEKEHILAYLLYIRSVKKKDNKPLSQSSIVKLISSLNGFFEYCFIQDFTLKELSAFLPPVKFNKTIKENIITNEEIEKVCKQIDLDSAVGYRDRLVIELMYTAGLRVGEVMGLNVWDIDLKHATITVTTGKGGKSRIVPLAETASFFVKEYIQQVRPYLAGEAEDDALIIGKKGKRLSRITFGQQIRKYGEDAGVKVTSHKFRHAFSVHMMERGCDVKFISALLGHESLETTQIYTTISDKEFRSKLEKFHFFKSSNKEVFVI